jgi:hypothetical protein
MSPATVYGTADSRRVAPTPRIDAVIVCVLQIGAANPNAVTKHDNTDLGFQLFDTYGIGYQLTGDASYKQIVLQAADTPARRYNPKVGMFRVWDAGRRPDAVPRQHRRDDGPGADVLGRQNGGDPQMRMSAPVNGVEGGGERAVPVPDQKPERVGAVAEFHQQVAGPAG